MYSRFRNSPLSTDTGIYRSTLADLLQATILCVGSGVLLSLAERLKIPVLVGIAGTLLYGVALLCSLRTRILAPVLFLGVAVFLPRAALWTVLRLTLSGIVLGLLPRNLRALYAVLAVAGVWSAVLLAEMAFSTDGVPIFQSSAAMLTTLLTELVGLSVLQLLCWTKLFTELFCLPPRRLSLRSTLVGICQMTTFATVGGIWFVLRWIDKHALLGDFFSHGDILCYLLPLVGIATAVGLFGATVFAHSLRLVRGGSTATPSPSLLIDQPLIAEFCDVQQTLLGKFRSLAEQAEARPLPLPPQPVETKPPARLENLALLCESSPVGALVVGTNGIVTSMSRRAREILRCGEEELVGQNITAFNHTPWSREIAGWISDAIDNARSLAGMSRCRYQTSYAEGSYLDVSLGVSPARSTPFAESVLHDYTPPSLHFITAYIQVIEDCRAFEQDLLAPTPIEIAGVNSLVLLDEIQRDLVQLLDVLRGTDARSDLLRSIAAFTAEAVTDSQSLWERRLEFAGEVQEFDVGTSVGAALRHLAGLTGLSILPPVQTAGDLRIRARSRDFHRLLSYLLGSLSEILLKGSAVSIALRGDPDGKVTAEISFREVRTPSNSLHSDFRLLLPGESSRSQASYIALRMQSRRLGGDTEFQNLAAQGNRITVSLPRRPPPPEAIDELSGSRRSRLDQTTLSKSASLRTYPQ